MPFRPPKKRKLQATAARRVRDADYTEEPNVKLSSAFVVVLVLHLVAVGGIYAFNALKALKDHEWNQEWAVKVSAPFPWDDGKDSYNGMSPASRARWGRPAVVVEPGFFEKHRLTAVA